LTENELSVTTKQEYMDMLISCERNLALVRPESAGEETYRTIVELRRTMQLTWERLVTDHGWPQPNFVREQMEWQKRR